MALNTILRTLFLGLLWFSYCESSQKKGYAIAFRKFLCDDFDALGPMNWWFDWRLKPFYHDGFAPNCTGLETHDATHRAMLWGWYPKKEKVLLPSATMLLGFNEGNHVKQARLTPAKAAAAWPTMENISNGLPLASPAAAPCGGSDCYLGLGMIEWFEQFFGNCTGCRVDYLQTHLYYPTASQVMNALQDLYTRFNRTIMLTEFAKPQDNDPANQVSFMQQLLPQLEAADHVHSYSWFASRITNGKYVKDAASLLHADNSTLTAPGEFYVNFNPA